MTTRFPRPLQPGDSIGVTAFSSGVEPRLLPRLEHITNEITARGYRIDEGQCLRTRVPAIPSDKGASASALERAAELNEFLHDPKVSVIAPPFGGELAIQVLPFIDFTALSKLSPKWVFGFSDVSTLLLPLTLCSGWGTLHCSNLMDLSSEQQDPLTTTVFDVLTWPHEREFVQHSSERWQLNYTDWSINPKAGFNLTEATEWKLLPTSPAHSDVLPHDPKATGVVFEGRLIGGCLDTLRHLAGTAYGDVPAFVTRNRAHSEGTILYLENCELGPFDLARTLLGLRLLGWFDGLSGLMLGRSSGPESSGAEDPYTYYDALCQSLFDLPYPVLYDVDVGHRQPQLCLVNGAFARVTFADGKGQVGQRLA